MNKVFLRLYSQSLILTLSASILAILQLLIVIFLTNTYDLKTVGSYTFALSIITPLSILLYQSYRTYIITNKTLTYNDSDFISNRLTVFILLSPVVIVIYLITNNPLVFFIYFLKGIDGFTDITNAFLNRNKELFKVSKINLFKSLNGFVVIAIAYILKINVEYFFVLLISSYTLQFFLYESKFLKGRFLSDKPFVDLVKNIIDLWKILKSLVIAGFIAALVYYIPKYFLGMIDLDGLGLFTVVTSISLGFNIIAASLGQSVQPWLVDSFHEPNIKKFLTIVLSSAVILVVFIVITLLLCTLFYDYIVEYIFNTNFPLKDFLIINLLFSTLYIGQLMSFVNLAIQKFRFVLLLNILSLVVLGIITYPLILIFGGIYGTTYSFMVLGILQTVGYTYSVITTFKDTRIL